MFHVIESLVRSVREEEACKHKLDILHQKYLADPCEFSFQAYHTEADKLRDLSIAMQKAKENAQKAMQNARCKPMPNQTLPDVIVSVSREVDELEGKVKNLRKVKNLQNVKNLRDVQREAVLVGEKLFRKIEEVDRMDRTLVDQSTRKDLIRRIQGLVKVCDEFAARS